MPIPIMNKIEEIIDTVCNNNTDDTDYKVFYRLEVKDCMNEVLNSIISKNYTLVKNYE